MAHNLAKKRRLTMERKLQFAGLVFLAPWIVGVLYFFVVPFIGSVVYSFNSVKVSTEHVGLDYNFIGLDNFRYILFRDSKFNRNVVDAVTSLLYTVPVVLLFSMFIAMLLNQKFRGRLFMRAVFFLPVIIASGVVIKIIRGDMFAQGNMGEASAIFQTGAVEEVLQRLNLPAKIVELLTGVTSSIFDLTWKSGIQILLFISALQGIPPSYYEAASIEGANSWDAFWKITFPILSPTSLLVAIYTIIDTFTDVANPVMAQLLIRLNENNYGIASASALIYFLVILVVIGLVSLLFSRRTFHNR